MVQHDKVLTRSKNGTISGTLGGIAEYFGLRRGRLQFVFIVLAFMGGGFLLYFILWVSIPSYSQRAKLLKRSNNNKI